MEEENKDSDKSSDSNRTMNNMMKAFIGANFPSNYEIEDLLHLIEIIKEKGKFIHPKDRNNNNLSKFTSCKSIFDQQIESIHQSQKSQ